MRITREGSLRRVTNTTVVGGVVVGPGAGGVGEVPVGNGDGTATWTDLEDFISGLDLWLTKIRGGQGTVNDLGDLGPAPATVDIALGNWHHGVLVDDCDITPIGWTDDRDSQVLLELAQDIDGGHTPTLIGITGWLGGTPTWDTTALSTTFVTLISREGGTRVWAAIAGGGASSAASDGMVPFLIESGETFTVPVKKQALFSVPITVGGLLVVDGYLIEVD